MRIIVFGGSGFIGRHLCSKLSELGHTVSLYSRSRTSLPGVNSISGCITDKNAVKSAICSNDIVYHLVNTGVPASSESIKHINTDIVGTVNILDAMRETGVKRLIYLSSGGAVYGIPKSNPINEDHKLAPISTYGVIKATAEMFCNTYSDSVVTTIIRPSNAYGPGQNLAKPQGVIAHFIKQIILDKPIEIWGDGSAAKDYIYISDLINLLTTVIQTGDAGVFNVGSGSTKSLTGIISILTKISGKSPKIKYATPLSVDVNKYCLDISKVVSTFDWAPSVPLEQGIEFQYAMALDEIRKIG